MLSVRSFEGVISGKTQFSQWKKHKTVNTHRSFVQFRKSPQRKLSIEYKRVEVGRNGGSARSDARSLRPGPFSLYNCDVILQAIKY